MDWALLLWLLQTLVVMCKGQGRLQLPLARSSVWRAGMDTAPNFDDHMLECGGYWYKKKLGDQCGLCGDAVDKPRDHERGGKFASDIITGSYTPGQRAQFQVLMASNHGGFMEFKLCPQPTLSQQCFDANPVTLTDGGTRFRMPRETKGVFNVDVIMPPVTCAHCVMQWTYTGDQEWGEDGRGEQCQGCGPQYQLRNCADITVTSSPGASMVPPAIQNYNQAMTMSGGGPYTSNGGGPSANQQLSHSLFTPAPSGQMLADPWPQQSQMGVNNARQPRANQNMSPNQGPLAVNSNLQDPWPTQRSQAVNSNQQDPWPMPRAPSVNSNQQDPWPMQRAPTVNNNEHDPWPRQVSWPNQPVLPSVQQISKMNILIPYAPPGSSNNPAVDPWIQNNNPTVDPWVHNNSPTQSPRMSNNNPTVDPWMRNNNPTVAPWMQNNPSLNPWMRNNNPTVDPWVRNNNPTVASRMRNNNPTVAPRMRNNNPTVDPWVGNNNPTVDPWTGNNNPTVDPWIEPWPRNGDNDPWINPEGSDSDSTMGADPWANGGMDGGSPVLSCVAIGTKSDMEGMGKWCTNNCNRGYCPKKFCSCDNNNPTVDPWIQNNNNPIADSMMQNNNPAEDPRMQNNNPVEDPWTQNNNPVEDPWTQNNNPVEDPWMQNNNPAVDPWMQNNNPTVDPWVGNNNPTVDPWIAPRPQNGNSDPWMNPEGSDSDSTRGADPEANGGMDGDSQALSCVAIGTKADMEGMGKWCTSNCNRGYCPEKFCSCD